MSIISAHFGFVPASQSSFPVAGACTSSHHASTADARLSIAIRLFFGTVATDHPVGQFHGVVLVLIMAHITGVSTSTAGKPQPTMALFVMFASSFVRQRLPFLHSRISYRLVINSTSTWTCKKEKNNILVFLISLGTVSISLCGRINAHV